MRVAKFVLASLVGLPGLALACDPVLPGSPFDALCALRPRRCPPGPEVAILSAFPAEQSVLRATTEVTERIEMLGRSVLIGRLSGQRVILVLAGIGLVNARSSTEALLARFDVSAILFSGVAGSRLNIADVAVPAVWKDVASGRTFPSDPTLLAAARVVEASDIVLGRCTPHPVKPPGPEVCLPNQPRVVVGGAGESSDPFGGGAARCQPGGDEIFGCEARLGPLATASDEIVVDAVDMETAAVADVAAAHGVPFLGVRGVSDGAGDPLGLPGFPSQFLAYYRVSADNAAAVVLRLLATLPESEGSSSERMRPGAACAFERAAGTDCRGASAPPRVERLVGRACVLRSRLAGASPGRATRLARRAAARWRRAAKLVERGSLPSCCAGALAERLRSAAAAVVETDATVQ